MRDNLAEGLRYVAGDRVVLWLFALFLIPTLFTQPYAALLPIFARDMEVGAEGLGLLLGASGLGSLASILVLASLGNYRRKGWLFFGSLIAEGALIFLFAASSSFLPSLAILVAIGMAGTVFFTLRQTLLQYLIPDEVRGRVMSLREVSFGFGPLGSLGSGIAADGFSRR